MATVGYILVDDEEDDILHLNCENTPWHLGQVSKQKQHIDKSVSKVKKTIIAKGIEFSYKVVGADNFEILIQKLTKLFWLFVQFGPKFGQMKRYFKAWTQVVLQYIDILTALFHRLWHEMSVDLTRLPAAATCSGTL